MANKGLPGSTNGLEGVLNVIFHGLFCFYPNGTDIVVRVPLIKQKQAKGGAKMPPHAYIAGNWLNERMLMPGQQYQLKGVQSGNGTFDKKKSFFLKGAKLAPKNGNLYAEMHFPKPKKIYSLLRMKIDKKFFKGKDKNMVKSVQEVSSVQVFTYHFKDHLKLQLEGLSPAAFSADGYLTQLPTDSKKTNYCSLHVFAVEDYPQPDQRHRLDDFETALSMYRKIKPNKALIDLRINKKPTITPVQPITRAQLPPGTILAEFDDLTQRAQRLSALGVRGHLKIDLNGIFEDDNAINGSDPLNCFNLT